MSQSTCFQLCRDGSSWVKPELRKDLCVLLKDTTQWRLRGSNPQPFLCLVKMMNTDKTLGISYKMINIPGLFMKYFDPLQK